MDTVMSGIAFEIALAYLDDVIIYSATLGQHFERLEVVLARLQDAG